MLDLIPGALEELGDFRERAVGRVLFNRGRCVVPQQHDGGLDVVGDLRHLLKC